MPHLMDFYRCFTCKFIAKNFLPFLSAKGLEDSKCPKCGGKIIEGCMNKEK